MAFSHIKNRKCSLHTHCHPFIFSQCLETPEQRLVSDLSGSTTNQKIPGKEHITRWNMVKVLKCHTLFYTLFAVICFYIKVFLKKFRRMANSVHPDQTSEAVWSGSALFCICHFVINFGVWKFTFTASKMCNFSPRMNWIINFSPRMN